MHSNEKNHIHAHKKHSIQQSLLEPNEGHQGVIVSNLRSQTDLFEIQTGVFQIQMGVFEIQRGVFEIQTGLFEIQMRLFEIQTCMSNGCV